MVFNFSFLFHQMPNVTMPFRSGYEETQFLESLNIKPEDIEFKAENCSKVSRKSQSNDDDDGDDFVHVICIVVVNIIIFIIIMKEWINEYMIGWIDILING